MTKEQPIIISTKNAEAVTGWPWRQVRDYARKMGVPVFKMGRKHGVDAKAFLAAIKSGKGEL
jgi:hypothetical protein